VRIPLKTSTIERTKYPHNAKLVELYNDNPHVTSEKINKWQEKVLNALLVGANPGDVVQINVKPFKGAHFAVFPPDIPELLIKAACPEDGVVLDPFAGAGTALVVAEKLDRRWIGIEISPEYCEIIKRRFENEVGDLVKNHRLERWLK